MPWGNKFPDMKNDPTYLEGRLSNAETSLAESTSDANNRGLNVKIPFGTNLTPAKGDSSTDDTSALQAIINYMPAYGTVFIPDGNYLVSAPLIINNSVSLVLSKGARIFTNTTMNNLIVYNSIYTAPSLKQLTGNIIITGGILDGNNKVQTVLALSQYMDIYVRDIKIWNFLLYGVITENVIASAAGLEMSGIQFWNNQANTGTIAIYNNGRDNYFHDIDIIDVETAIWTYDSHFQRIHHWISLTTLLPNSCTLNINDGYAMFSQIISDTIRYPFKLASGKLTRINDSLVEYNTSIYTSSLASTYPITIFNGDTTVSYYAKNNLLAVPFNLTMCQNVYQLGSITGNQIATANGAVVTNQVDMNALYQLKGSSSALSNDFNNATTTGIYTISNPSSTWANYPSGAYAYGVLEVFQSTDQTVQVFTPLSGFTKYTRTGKTGSWQTWVPIGNSSGVTANRPTTGLYVGYQHFDTTLGKPIYCKTTSPVAWVDATGTTV